MGREEVGHWPGTDMREALREYLARELYVLLPNAPAPWGPYTLTMVGEDFACFMGSRRYYLAIAHIVAFWPK